MATRISSLDDGYTSGDLSLFPDAVDDRTSLYEATNNSSTILKFALSYSGKYIIVEDASNFPSTGILRIGPASGEGNAELIYYGSRTNTVFTDLIRGFAKSVQTSWSSGAYVTNSVAAEHHNAVKDAVLKTEWYIGLESLPDSESLNGIIKSLEERYLAPKAEFKAYPQKGPPSLTVRFQSLCSDSHTVRYLWDFGDGTNSIEKNPNHTYTAEGLYSVKLVVYTSAGGQGLRVKDNYIKISESENVGFFYVVQTNPNQPAYSITTATSLGGEPAVFSYVDQTDGDIVRRIWIFGDGNSTEVDDPNTHTIIHSYNDPGEYSPSLINVYGDQTIKRVFLNNDLTIL